MSNPTPTPDSSTPSTPSGAIDPSAQSADQSLSEPASATAARGADNPSTKPSAPTPLRCFTGAMIAGGIAAVLYQLTLSIIETFANKPLPSGNYIAVNIAVAVRTLVMGMSAMATGIFAIAALGLLALGVQLLVQQLRQPST